MAKPPSSGRKTPSRFLDNNDGDNSLRSHVHVSPSPCPNTTYKSQCDSVYVAKTNLIGDSVDIPEEHRAVAFTKYGEKRPIQLDEGFGKPLCTGPSKLAIGGGHVANSHAKQTKQFSEPILNLTNENDAKTMKRSKVARRHMIQKSRPTFTPRRVESSHSTRVNQQPWPTNIISVETQTNSIPSILTPSQINPHDTTTTQNFSIPAIPEHRLINVANNNLNTRQNSAAFYRPAPVLRSTAPKLYTKSNRQIKNFPEIRGIVSFLTLITVLSWLITIYFELEMLTELLNGIVQKARNWYIGNEKPKTKMEILVEFLANLW